MTAAARARFYDAGHGLFLSGPQRQASWASQAWMVHAGVVTGTEAATVMRNVMRLSAALRPRTPYLYHYVVDALLLSGLKQEAADLLRSYWGGMVEAGADTFWEVYDPA